MKQILSSTAALLVATGLTVGLAGTANAGTLKTAPFYASGTDRVTCSGTNVGSSALGYVTVAIIAHDGIAVSLNVCHDVTPGGSCATSVEAPKGGFCGMVFPGSSKHVRGSICLDDENGNPKAVLPAQ